MANIGSIAVGVLGGIATGLLVAGLIVADRPGPPSTMPVGVREVPVVTSVTSPVTITLSTTAPTVTQLMSLPAMTTTKTSTSTSTSTVTETTTSPPTTTTTSASPSPSPSS